MKQLSESLTKCKAKENSSEKLLRKHELMNISIHCCCQLVHQDNI